MSIQHRLYFKSCFICQTNEEGKWGLEPYDLASLVVINPIHRERNMLYLLLHPFRRMRATSPEGGSFAENKEKILNLICFALSYPIPYHTPFPVWEGEFNALHPRRSWILLITVPHFLHQKTAPKHR